MDLNTISFEALFNCNEFERYTSPAYKKATEKYYKFLADNISDPDIRDKFESEANRYCAAAEESSFEQGFRFAVKLLRHLYDMSFPDVPPRI